jgi:Ca-activated chloride channel family protein
MLRSKSFFAFLWRIMVVGACLPTLSWAQTSLDQLHVLPRPRPAAFESQRPIFRTNINLVLVPVTVLDHEDRLVSGLRPENFTIFDNKLPQTIRYFSREDLPISLTVILDTSGSMGSKIRDARNAAIELFESSNPDDDFNLITFGDKPRDQGATDSLEEIRNLLSRAQPDGYTALWDALYLGLVQLRHARYGRKAIVIISDGGDNHSRYTEKEIRSLLEESDVQVYAIGIFDRYPGRVEERTGPLRLDEITSMTGGRMFSVHDRDELTGAANQISLELKNQYVLGYYPRSSEPDGKWRRIQVRLKAVETHDKLRLRARKGYYGPGE